MKHAIEHHTQWPLIAVRVISYVVASIIIGGFADLTLTHAARMLS